jgi:hypothetical protein
MYIGLLNPVIIRYTIVANPEPTNAPERGTLQIYPIRAVAVKQLSIICTANSTNFPNGGLSLIP